MKDLYNLCVDMGLPDTRGTETPSVWACVQMFLKLSGACLFSLYLTLEPSFFSGQILNRRQINLTN